METGYGQASACLATRSPAKRLFVSRWNVNSIRLKTDGRCPGVCERARRDTECDGVTLHPRNSKRSDAACFRSNRCESHNISLFGLDILTWNRCLRLPPRDPTLCIVPTREKTRLFCHWNPRFVSTAVRVYAALVKCNRTYR